MAKKKTRKKVAKKKAPRKPKPKPQVVIEVSKGVPLVAEIEVPEIDYNDPYYLRHAAGTHYVTNSDLPTLHVLSETEPFIDVGIATLQAWCRVDRWVVRRKEFLEEFQQGIVKKIMSERVRNMQARLKENEAQLQQLDLLLPSAEPNSYEGMSSVRIKLVDQIERQEDAIEVRVSSTVAQVGGPAHQIKPELSQEESRAAVRAIIQLRRDKLKEAVVSDATVQAVEPQPKPKKRKKRPPAKSRG